MGVIDEYRREIFFAVAAEPSILKDLAKTATTAELRTLRDNLVKLKTLKIDGNEAAVGQLFGLRFGNASAKLTEVIDERGD
jgi:hypothetical protein